MKKLHKVSIPNFAAMAGIVAAFCMLVPFTPALGF